MRKIEEDMIQAIRSGTNRSLGNTVIHHEADSETCTVKLHNNQIAKITNSELTLSHCGWTTPTTKSRLNAILEGLNIDDRVYQRKFSWYTNGGLFEDNNVWVF